MHSVDSVRGAARSTLDRKDIKANLTKSRFKYIFSDFTSAKT